MSTPRPDKPSTRPHTFSGVIRSPSTQAAASVAHSGMVKAMMEARPAGISDTP